MSLGKTREATKGEKKNNQEKGTFQPVEKAEGDVLGGHTIEGFEKSREEAKKRRGGEAEER